MLLASARPRLAVISLYLWLLVRLVGAPASSFGSRTVELPLQSLIEPSTQKLHDAAILDFQEWLHDEGLPLTVNNLLEAPTILSRLLVAYGQYMYSSRKPRFLFLICVTAMQRYQPALKPYFKSVWQLATNWRLVEPVNHRHPIPVTLVKAMIALALTTGSSRWAGVTILSFWGLARIGEVLKALRCHLLLPKDILFAATDRTFLHYDKPKSRNRGGASHQHSLIRGLGFANMLSHIFADLKNTDRLYSLSPATYRSRWNKFLKFLGVPSATGFTPGGLRGGGAVASYMSDMPIPDIMWRMRVSSTNTLEHYLQEVAALTSLRSLPKRSVSMIIEFAALFDATFHHFSSNASQK